MVRHKCRYGSLIPLLKTSDSKIDFDFELKNPLLLFWFFRNLGYKSQVIVVRKLSGRCKTSKNGNKRRHVVINNRPTGGSSSSIDVITKVSP